MSDRVTSTDAWKDRGQLAVGKFMAKINHPSHPTPPLPEIPSYEARLARVKLVLEETRELINALGFNLCGIHGAPSGTLVVDTEDNLGLTTLVDKKLSLVEIADACADVDVVGPKGTAEICGFAYARIENQVDGNNLLKFAPGHSIDENHKFCKPANHPSVTEALRTELLFQGAREEDVQ